MPKDNIDRALKKSSGELGGEMIQEITYEAYGPSGITFIIEMATDNINRTAQDMRTFLSKNHGAVTTPGSVSYQFDKRCEIRVSAEDVPENKIMEAAIEAGADDVQSEADEHTLLTAANELGTIANLLCAAGMSLISEKLVYTPQNLVVIGDLEIARQIIKLHDLLDDYPDTLNVFTNFEVADEILDQLAS
jgi:YebC/PmpR family DNA-binding regulatory protein